MTDTVETRWESHNEAGRRYFGQGEYAQAEQAFIAAIREATLLGADNVRLASSLSNLGQLKYRQKDLPQAEALFRRSLAIRERVLGAEHFSLVQGINNLAALHYTRGELEQAEPLFRRALAISEAHLGADHPDLGVPLNNLARLYFRRNDHAAAAQLLTRLLAIKQAAVGPDHPEVAAILTSLAKVRGAEGDHGEAEQLARRALALREPARGAGQPGAAAARGTGDEPRPAVDGAQLGALSTGTTGEFPRVVPNAPPPRPQPRPAEAPRAPSTRSVSLPWIEPPTSPALRAPVPVQHETSATAASASDRPASAPPAAPERRGSSSAGTMGRAIGSGPVRDVPKLVLDAPDEPVGRDRRGVMQDWPMEPRRPWLKLAAAAALLAGIGAGAWVLRGRAGDGTVRSVAGDASSAVSPVKTAEARTTPPAGAETALAAPAASAPAPNTPQPAVQPAARETLATSRPAPRETATRPHRDDATDDLTPALPRVNVDRVTNAIGRSARARADSLGRAITVKPPTFGDGKPK